MHSPLLTIAIPTYNRAGHLKFLLSVLAIELRDAGRDVRVLIFDNASPDDTPSVIARHAPRIADLVHRRNAQNVGADHNIRNCFRDADTPYVWILGDDDAPLPGAIAQLLTLLKQSSPDIVYLPSCGTADLMREYGSQPRVDASWATLTREQFASVVNVRFTFISALVFRKEGGNAQAIADALGETDRTNLIQLAWTYEILKEGTRFMIARQNLLMASSDNRGGYSALQVFLVNHTRIVTRLLASHPEVARRILSRTSSCHVPGLLWNLRTNRFGDFVLGAPDSVSVPPELSQCAGYRYLAVPIWTLPKALAWVFFQTSRVVARSARASDKRLVWG